MKGKAILSIIILALVLTGIQLATRASGTDYYLTQLTMAAYYTIVALGLCLLMGYAGQISLGHGAFFALGGYTTAVLTTTHIAGAGPEGWAGVLHAFHVLASRQDLYGDELITFTPSAAFLVAILLTILVALLVGYPSLRLKGHYLAMATLGFGLIVYRIVLGSDFTGSADGITSVPPWELAPGLVISGKRAFRVENYYFAWGCALITLLLLLNIVGSRIGRALRSIHDGELAANAMGVNTGRMKLQVFVLSAVLAAMAGCLLTHFNAGIGPSEASAMKSIRYVALVAAGGMASIWGVLWISSIITFLSLRGLFGSYDHAFFGVVLIVIISLAPEGPLKPLGQGVRRLFARRPRETVNGAA